MSNPIFSRNMNCYFKNFRHTVPLNTLPLNIVRLIFLSVVCLCGLASTVVGLENDNEAIVDAVLLTVQGEPLTWSELKRFLAARGEKVDSELLKQRSALRAKLRDYLMVKLVEREGAELGVTVDESDVEAYIGAIQAQNGVDAEGFREILAEQGISESEYQSQIRADILRSRVMSARIRSKIEVVDEDVERFFEKHPERLPAAGSVRLKQIRIPLADESLELSLDAPQAVDAAPAKVRARELRSRLAAGEPWPAVGGNYYSDLGFVQSSDLLPELQEVIVGLDVDKVSPIVETSNGIYIVSVSARSTSDGTIDPGLKEEVRSQLFEERYNLAVEKYFTEELPGKYQVDWKLSF